jgi:hypothetical protein
VVNDDGDRKGTELWLDTQNYSSFIVAATYMPSENSSEL